jgi:hypothetical protein
MRRVRSQFLKFSVGGRVGANGVAVRPFQGTGASSVSSAWRAGSALVAACLLVVGLALVPVAQAGKYVDRVIGSTATGTTGGLFNSPQGIAVNATGAGGVAAGTFYVVDQINNRVQRFSQAGAFERAWGVDVNLPAGGTAFEVCTVAASCKVGVANAGGGGMSAPSGVAVDGDTGFVYVPDRNNRRVLVFDADGGFLRAFGFDVVSAGPGNTGTGFEICVAANGDTCKVGVAGTGVGQYGAGTTNGTYGLSVTPPDGNAATGKVYLANSGNRRVEVYGLDGAAPSSFGSATDFATNQPRKLAVSAGGIVYASDNQASNEVDRYDTVAATFLAPIDVNSMIGSATTSGLAIDRDTGNLLVMRQSAADGAAEIANPAGAPSLVDRHFTDTASVDVAINPNTDEILTVTTHRVLIADADGVTPRAIAQIGGTTDIGSATATINATVDSNGAFPTAYRLEISRNGIDWTTVATGTVAGGASQAISTPVGDLRPNTLYRVRVAANKTLANPDVFSPESTFLTDAIKPTIVSSGADSVQDTSARLTGYINPHSTTTSYRFEWGTEPGVYPNHAPALPAVLGAGPDPVLAAQSLTGLQPATTYYSRLVAISATEGTTTGPERSFTTASGECGFPNEHGLPSCRVLELVSPPNMAPFGEADGYVNIAYVSSRGRLSDDGKTLDYILAYGLPDSTMGSDVMYRASLGDGGWKSSQLSPAPIRESRVSDSSGMTVQEVYTSDDLSCGFVNSQQPLAADAPEEVLDAGGVLLFRRNPDGTYTTITDEVPTSPRSPEVWTSVFTIIGASDDCGTVVFTTKYVYPGVPASGNLRPIYKWDHGVLSNIGTVPGPSGPELSSDAVAGGRGNAFYNAVSTDGSRTVFTANSKVGADLGKRALFVDDDGTTIDISQSQTATVNQGAFYQDASEDGSKVFFIANYGLTGPVPGGIPATTDCENAGLGSPTSRCDLYEYDLDTSQLTNLSSSTDLANTEGAVVEGVLDVSDDGEYVYFAARGQLVPGKGNTYAQNIAGSGAYNIYLAHDDALSFVAVAPRADVIDGVLGPGLLTSPRNQTARPAWTSRSTRDGRHLLFQSSGNVTGYDSGSIVEVYRYSVDTDTVVCVSCRLDGAQSVPMDGTNGVLSLLGGRATGGYHEPLRWMSEDAARIFFRSGDALAPGGVDGNQNLYQWENGLVSLIVSQAPGSAAEDAQLSYLGTNEDGSSAFFSTRLRLLPTDRSDDDRSIYVARVNGVAADVPEPVEQCGVLVGACQSGGGSALAPSIGTTDAAAGNAAGGERNRLSVAAVSRGALRKASRSGVVALAVRSARAVRVTAVAKGRLGGRVRQVASGGVSLVEGGRGTLRLRLSKAARQRLARGRALRLAITVRAPGSRSRTTTVRLPGASS